MYKLINILKLQGAFSQNAKADVKLGTVSGYDPANYLAKVVIYPGDDQDQGFETSWLPVFTPWVGNGWGMFCPPLVGDLVEVHFQEGSLQTAFVGLRTYNNEDRPLNVPAGEFWLVHATGAFVKLTNDGNVEISASNVNVNASQDCNINANNATITTTGETTVTSAGPINLDSTVVNLGTGTLTALMNGAAAAVYNTHTHIESGGMTSTFGPSATMGSSTQTTNVKAS